MAITKRGAGVILTIHAEIAGIWRTGTQLATCELRRGLRATLQPCGMRHVQQGVVLGRGRHCELQ
jgi:hypothetical protein